MICTFISQIKLGKKLLDIYFEFLLKITNFKL